MEIKSWLIYLDEDGNRMLSVIWKYNDPDDPEEVNDDDWKREILENSYCANTPFEELESAEGKKLDSIRRQHKKAFETGGMGSIEKLLNSGPSANVAEPSGSVAQVLKGIRQQVEANE